jgi:hypothetical protein
MRWSNMITKINRFKTNFNKKLIWIAFFKSHFTFRNKTQNKLSINSRSNSFQYYCNKQILIKRNSLICIYRNNDSFTESHQIVLKKNYCERKKFIIVIFLKKNNSHTKLLFSLIIIYVFKTINTIQSFREIKLRKGLILRNFYHIHQDFIIAYQKNLDRDSEYCSLNTVFTLIILNQFFRDSF